MAKPAPAAPAAALFDDGTTVDAFSQKAFGAMVAATKASNVLPATDSHSYYATFPAFKDEMDKLSKRLLAMAQGLMGKASPNDPPNLTSYDSAVDDPVARFEDDVLDHMDELYEQVDAFMDEYSGQREKSSAVAATPTQMQMKGRPGAQILHGANIIRPQDSWKIIVDNSSTPFVPKITEKPHALVPLAPIFSSVKLEANGLDKLRRTVSKLPAELSGHASALGLQDETASAYPHPYEYELSHLDWTEDMLQPRKETMYGPLQTTPLTWVDTPQKLTEMMVALEQASEIAIDLEHHDYRSFLGFTCLIQISTRREDFLVDPFPLMEDLQVLNKVTANPKIVKVLHGSDRDVLWLQRDFGVYIVNMFDTGQAARVLDHPSFALAHLLKHYCSVNADKQFQLADWRIRPLPEAMVRYAREDTHYLLYIYDRMRNEALQRGNESANLLRSILDRSREICLSLYEKELFTEESYRDLYDKYNFTLDAKQLRVFAALYKWRDTVARQEDESSRYVLPPHMMLHVAEMMPKNTTDLLGLLNPIPPLVRVHASDLVLLIRNAAREPTEVDDEMEVIVPNLFQESAQANVSGIGVRTVVSTGDATKKDGSSAASTPAKNESRPSLPPKARLAPAVVHQREKTANWLEDPEALKLAKLVKLSGPNSGYIAHKPQSKSLFFDKDDRSDDDEEARKLAEEIQRSFHVDMLLPPKLDFEEEVPLKPKAYAKKQSKEAEDVSGEEEIELPAPASDAMDVDKSDKPKEKDKEKEKEKKEKPKPAAEGKSEKKGAKASSAPPTPSDMPKSLADIYKLSANKNKKRKKKSKDSNASTNDKGDESSDDEPQERSPKRARQEPATTPKL